MRDPANNYRACDALLQRLFCIAVLMVLFLAMPVNADEIRPALLDIKEQNTGLFAVTWKVPTRGDRVLALTPQLPNSLELLGSPTIQDMPGARIEHATYKNNGESLTGQIIVIDVGLSLDHWVVEGAMQIVVEIGAGGDDEVHEAGLNE